MNRLDEVMKDLESRGYGEHTERIGKGIVWQLRRGLFCNGEVGSGQVRLGVVR